MHPLRLAVRYSFYIPASALAHRGRSGFLHSSRPDYPEVTEFRFTCRCGAVDTSSLIRLIFAAI